jgi:hypothetical protein
MLPVYCLKCGAELRRADDPRGDAGRACYQWFDLAGARVDNCPGCGAVTSLLTTTDGPTILTKLCQLPDPARSLILYLLDYCGRWHVNTSGKHAG